MIKLNKISNIPYYMWDRILPFLFLPEQLNLSLTCKTLNYSYLQSETYKYPNFSNQEPILYCFKGDEVCFLHLTQKIYNRFRLETHLPQMCSSISIGTKIYLGDWKNTSFEVVDLVKQKETALNERLYKKSEFSLVYIRMAFIYSVGNAHRKQPQVEKYSILYNKWENAPVLVGANPKIATSFHNYLIYAFPILDIGLLEIARLNCFKNSPWNILKIASFAQTKRWYLLFNNGYAIQASSESILIFGGTQNNVYQVNCKSSKTLTLNHDVNNIYVNENFRHPVLCEDSIYAMGDNKVMFSYNLQTNYCKILRNEIFY